MAVEIQFTHNGIYILLFVCRLAQNMASLTQRNPHTTSFQQMNSRWRPIQDGVQFAPGFLSDQGFQNGVTTTKDSKMAFSQQ